MFNTSDLPAMLPNTAPSKSRKAKVGQWNPHWSVMKQANQAIVVIEAELGIAPVRRDKAVKVARATKARRASDEFLQARK
jgi:phage terminase small subunit